MWVIPSTVSLSSWSRIRSNTSLSFDLITRPSNSTQTSAHTDFLAICFWIKRSMNFIPSEWPSIEVRSFRLLLLDQNLQSDDVADQCLPKRSSSADWGCESISNISGCGVMWQTWDSVIIRFLLTTLLLWCEVDSSSHILVENTHSS